MSKRTVKPKRRARKRAALPPLEPRLPVPPVFKGRTVGDLDRAVTLTQTLREYDRARELLRELCESLDRCGIRLLSVNAVADGGAL